MQDIYHFTEVEKGLFAGVDLSGATAVPRNELDAAYYGRPATAKEIVIDHGLSNQQAAPLRAALSDV